MLAPRALALLGSAAGSIAAPACGGPSSPVAARSCPEAERIFHEDPRWLGGDAAYSIPLDGERVVWLFGDSFIAEPGSTSRRESVMVRNSVAVQTGLDPTTAEMEFAWRESPAGPGSFFPEPGDGTWIWPSHGVHLDGALLLFLSLVGPSDGGLGFQSVGWDAIRIENADLPPSEWRWNPVLPPGTGGRAIAGAAAVLRADGYVFVYAVEEPSHDLYLVRWTELDARVGRLDDSAEWWTASGWGDAAAAIPVIEDAATELSVHEDPILGWTEIQTEGFGAAELVIRTAFDPTGDWSSARHLHHPPESDRDGVFVYAGKAHPELVSREGDLLVTYATNHRDFGTLLDDQTLYFPRFVCVARR